MRTYGRADHVIMRLLMHVMHRTLTNLVWYIWLATALSYMCHFSVKLLMLWAQRLTSATQPPAAVLHTSLSLRSCTNFRTFRSLNTNEAWNESESSLRHLKQRPIRRSQKWRTFVLLKMAVFWVVAGGGGGGGGWWVLGGGGVGVGGGGGVSC
jgi:hypothetical protein